jgi:hypothetical protein
VPVRLREEVQALLRRGDRKLTGTPDSSNGSAPTPECDTRGGARFGMKRRLGYKGYVIEARSHELSLDLRFGGPPHLRRKPVDRWKPTWTDGD